MSLYTNTDRKKGETINHINNQCTILYNLIEKKQEHLVNLLLDYESFETAKDEISQSLDSLKNISKEIEWLSYGKVDLLCTIFPVNLPLYSLLIFAIIPGFMANEVVVRPPILMREVLSNLCALLNFKELFGHIKFVDLERSLFNEAYILVSDVIIFTGRYENAKIIQKSCPDVLFIYDGAGINPAIVTGSANIENTIKKMIKTRIFNSGQDCAGPDMIFVHKKIASDFHKKLLAEISKIKIGDYHNRNVRVGRIVKIDQLSKIQEFFDIHGKSIVYGGKIDFDNSIIYPTVIIEDIKDLDKITAIEFFSPIFYLLVYSKNSELNKYFSHKSYRDFAMYASIFGQPPNSLQIPDSVILSNQVINDVEHGNEPYGGYGSKANFVSYQKTSYHRPLLISREISNYLKKRHKSKE